MVAVYAPLAGFMSEERAEALTEQGLFGDTPHQLQAAWGNLSDLWRDTVARAGRLPLGALDESVGGEWSFLQTIRHLVFVADAWHRDVIEERPQPHHPWGMPPHFMVQAAPALGLDLSARPSLGETLVIWDDRRLAVTAYLDGVTNRELQRTCTPRDGQFQVIGAVQTIVSETWAHLQYATRDLAVLEQG